MACSGDCWDFGPPPDSILRMPPPPLPAFLQLSRAAASNLSSGPCRPASLCGGGDHHAASASSASASAGGVAHHGDAGANINKLFPGVEYIELPHHDSSSADDTWFLVLITSCVAVVLLGALLALFLLKCRETYTFHFSESGARKQGPLPASDLSTAAAAGPLHHHHHQSKAAARPLGGDAPMMMYPEPQQRDNRALWAALTPRGTQHFLADIYPQDCISASPGQQQDNQEDGHHYESVDALNFKAGFHEKFTFPASNHYAESATIGSTRGTAKKQHHGGHNHNHQNHNGGHHHGHHGGHHKVSNNNKSSFENSAFMDYDYEDPAPLIESYQLEDMMMMERYQQQDFVDDSNPYYAVDRQLAAEQQQLQLIQQQQQQQPTLLRRGSSRPLVSSPTRIEHPNLPPLNLYPHQQQQQQQQQQQLRNGGGGTGGTLRKPSHSRRVSDSNSYAGSVN